MRNSRYKFRSDEKLNTIQGEKICTNAQCIA